MIRHGPDSAEVRVFVFRDGVLSDFGYDLRFRVMRFDIEEEEGTAPAIRARFDPTSLQLETALRAGREMKLSASDAAEIQRKLVEVLRPDRYPEVRFESTAITRGGQSEREAPGTVTGKLALFGATNELTFPWRREGGARVVEVAVDQRAFGIKPFRAMMGALKVKPEVLVRVWLPG